MGILSKEVYEAKEAYAANRMTENAKIETLTEEQHSALAHLCQVRHEIHCNQDDLFYTGCGNYDYYWKLVGNDFDFAAEIGKEFISVGLPYPPLLDYELPNDEYYYNVLTDEEVHEWEDKAERFNNEERKKGQFYHSGHSLWIEEGDEYDEFKNAINKWNCDVEAYLRNIDKQHGSNYCPSGIARMR